MLQAERCEAPPLDRRAIMWMWRTVWEWWEWWEWYAASLCRREACSDYPHWKEKGIEKRKGKGGREMLWFGGEVREVEETGEQMDKWWRRI